MFEFTNVDPDFWIQNVGSDSGKPIREEIPNSIGIKCDPVHLVPDFFFYVVLHLHRSGDFNPFIKGSVIPFITHKSIGQVIINYFIKRALINNINGVPDAKIRPQGSGILL